MSTLTHDIIISGAGPVGTSLALMLAAKARNPGRIALIGKLPGRQTAAPGQSADTPDPRTLALNHGSRVMLEQLGAWPKQAADIHTVHVSQQRRLGRTVIDCRDLDVPRLGSVVAYDSL